MHHDRWTVIKKRVGWMAVFTVFSAIPAHAALLDCAQSRSIFSTQDCLAVGVGTVSKNGIADIPVAAPAAVAKPHDFHINPQATDNISSSALLIAMMSTLLMVLLFKARAFNTK